MQMQIPHGGLLVGISLGGLVAAKLQDLAYTKIMVSPPSSSTWTDNDGAWQALHLRTTIELSGPRCTVEPFGPTRR
jgi:hypothetical protein